MLVVVGVKGCSVHAGQSGQKTVSPRLVKLILNFKRYGTVCLVSLSQGLLKGDLSNICFNAPATSCAGMMARSSLAYAAAVAAA